MIDLLDLTEPPDDTLTDSPIIQSPQTMKLDSFQLDTSQMEPDAMVDGIIRMFAHLGG